MTPDPRSPVVSVEAHAEQIAAALPEASRTLIVELADNHARHVWLQQEGAYHLGLAVGRRLRLRGAGS
jgi:hypothetical protein